MPKLRLAYFKKGRKKKTDWKRTGTRIRTPIDVSRLEVTILRGAHAEVIFGAILLH